MSRYSRTGWKKIDIPDLLTEASPQTIGYQKEVADGHLSVFVGPEPAGWHLSISHRLSNSPHTPGRYPTWDEIKEARYEFCPKTITMAMLLPPPDEYVNVHETTFHLHELQE